MTDFSAFDTPLRLFLTPEADPALGREIACETGALLSPGTPPPGEEAPFLCLDGMGLSLWAGGQCVRGDFGPMLPRLRAADASRETLLRAVCGKDAPASLCVLDATAGLGEDSLLLARAGCRVILCERDPVIAALLRDALRRAPSLCLTGAAGRMTLCAEDSTAVLARLPAPPDVVYLDPMFPERQKSGLVKKKFQVLHYLEAPCPDEETLLGAALAAHPARIVIKRPAKGPCLAGRKPSYSLPGKSIRFDVIVL